MCRQLPTIPNSERVQLIDEWIHSERDRQILKMSLIDKISYEKIAEHFEMSDRQIRRIIKKGVSEIIIHM